MRRLFKRVRNEKGAISLEFLGIIPFFFMFFLILWQVVASGYAVYTLKAAVNEGAKTFSLTEDINETKDTIVDAIGSSNVIAYDHMQVVYLDGNGKFKLNVEAKHSLVFVPSQWKDETAVELEESTISQVLVK